MILAQAFPSFFFSLSLRLFFFLFFWYAHKRKILGDAERTFLYHAICVERGVVFPAFSVLYSCIPAELEPDAGVAFQPHRDPTQTSARQKSEAFSLRQNTGLLCAIPLQMISLFDGGGVGGEGGGLLLPAGSAWCKMFQQNPKTPNLFQAGIFFFVFLTL